MAWDSTARVMMSLACQAGAATFQEDAAPLAWRKGWWQRFCRHHATYTSAKTSERRWSDAGPQVRSAPLCGLVPPEPVTSRAANRPEDAPSEIFCYTDDETARSSSAWITRLPTPNRVIHLAHASVTSGAFARVRA